MQCSINWASKTSQSMANLFYFSMRGRVRKRNNRFPVGMCYKRGEIVHLAPAKKGQRLTTIGIVFVSGFIQSSFEWLLDPQLYDSSQIELLGRIEWDARQSSSCERFCHQNIPFCSSGPARLAGWLARSTKRSAVLTLLLGVTGIKFHDSQMIFPAKFFQRFFQEKSNLQNLTEIGMKKCKPRKCN